MIQIVGPQFSQWDSGRSVSVSNTDATHIHFANQGDSKAVIIDIVDGVANIPAYLFVTGKTLLAYAVLHEGENNRVTLESKSFAVRKRERPEDYVYEDDQRNYIYELTVNAENAAEDANLAAQNANDAAVKANKAAESWVLIGEARGESISINDAINQSLAGFRIFGKTTQDGVPTPEAPVDLVSVENPTVAVNEQSMLVPYTLHGIPVKTGGNYTDANGQQWVCDAVDFDRGCLVRRIQRITFDQINHVARYEQPSGSGIYRFNMPPNESNPIVSVRFSSHNRGMSNALQFNEGVLGHNATDNCVSTYANGGLYARCDSIVSEEAFLETARENNWVVLSVLETPIETPLSPEELAAYASLHTTRGNTTVSNDAGAWMDLAYAMDAKKYIDSKIASAILPATVE